MRAVRPNSFSLVEMLVAIAILSLMSLLVFSVMNASVKMWRDQGAKEQSFREARAALFTMSRDLGTSLPSTNSGWFYYSSTNFAFLASQPDDAQASGLDKGDVCAVGYSLEWGKENPSNAQESSVMALYRYIRFSTPTYNTIINVPGATVQSIFSNPDGTNTVRELVARNVAQIQITPYTTDSTGAVTSALGTISLPNLIDFSMIVLNDRTASQFATQLDWQNTTAPLFIRNMETFRLRMRSTVP